MRPCTCNQRNLYWQTNQKDVLPWECGACLYLLACVMHPQCHLIDLSTVPIDCTTTTWHKKRGVIVKMDLPHFLLCCITPQDKNNAWSLLRNSPYCSICEMLPPFPGMRVRLAIPHCEIIKITLCHYMQFTCCVSKSITAKTSNISNIVSLPSTSSSFAMRSK